MDSDGVRPRRKGLMEWIEGGRGTKRWKTITEPGRWKRDHCDFEAEMEGNQCRAKRLQMKTYLLSVVNDLMIIWWPYLIVWMLHCTATNKCSGSSEWGQETQMFFLMPMPFHI